MEDSCERCYVHSSSSYVTLQSSADLRLLNGLPPVSFTFGFSFQFVIMLLLTSVCTQLNHLLFLPPLSRLP